ncbi:MAG: processing protein [Chlorobi bacterium]|nr:processing protein [Chlorobiota bacterium]
MLSQPDILALGYLPGITSAALRALAESGASFREIITAPDEELAALGLRRAALSAIRASEPYMERAAAQVGMAAKLGAAIIQFWDDRYPDALRQIYAPPITLYVMGEIQEGDARAIAIVGTRGASVYGRLAAERYAERFAFAGVTVVSGLARGIDTYAHAAAMRAGGRTIAVIASGLDAIQPAISAGLAERIRDHGAVISEYPFGVKALRPYFPQRNRIVSGISAGTVVVESDERGGALITAGFALDQGREVFAVPGPISSPKSRGTNMLIRTDRARLTQSPEDLLDAVGYHIPIPERDGAAPAPDLSLFEQQIYDVLGGEPVHVDAICDATEMASNEVLVNLLSLEFKGLVRQMAGKMFLRG